MAPDALRPRVMVNFAVSLDGKINPAPDFRPGAFAMSRGKEDWRRMGELRTRADAILIGASNLRLDDPPLALPADERARRGAAGRPLPARVVVTTRGAGIRPDARMFDLACGGPPVVAHAAAMPPETREALGAVARLVELGDESVSVGALLGWMRRELGVQTVMCEGGGVLVAELFAARAVDELYLTLVPRVLGGAAAPTLVAGPGFAADQIPDPVLESFERIGDELYLRYDFAWE